MASHPDYPGFGISCGQYFARVETPPVDTPASPVRLSLATSRVDSDVTVCEPPEDDRRRSHRLTLTEDSAAAAYSTAAGQGRAGRAVSEGLTARVYISAVVPGSPADHAGIKVR